MCIKNNTNKISGNILLHILYKTLRKQIMDSCSNLFCLSAIACQLSKCLSENEMTKLAADLVVLSDMLANIIAHQEFIDENYVK